MLATLYRKIQRLLPMDITHFLVWDLTGSPTQNTTAYASETQAERRANSQAINAASSVHRVEKLNLASAELYLNDPSYDLTESFLASSDDPCQHVFGLYVEDTLAGYLALSESPVAAALNTGGYPFTGIGLRFPSSVLYLYKVFVHPSFRGNGLFTELVHGAINAMPAEKLRAIVTTTDWTNTNYLKGTNRLGFTKHGLAAEIVAGKHFYFLPKPVSLPGDNEHIELFSPAKTKAHVHS